MSELLNQEFEFPVVGTQYVEGAYDRCVAVSPGTPLELVQDPQNPYDTDAIEVHLDGVRIGFVPNSGYSCSDCWYPVDPRTYTCVNCGQDKFIIKKGLATRIAKLGTFLHNYGCLVEKVVPSSKSVPIHAKLIVLEGPQ